MLVVEVQYTGDRLGQAGNAALSRYFFRGTLPGPQGSVDAVRAMYADLAGSMSNSTTITFPDSVRIVEESSGQTTGFSGVNRPAPVVGTSTTEPVPPIANVRLNWTTNVFKHGREVRGRNYWGGFGSGAVVNGILISASFTALQTAMNNFRNTTDFGIYHVHRRENGQPLQVPVREFVEVTGGSPSSDLWGLRRRLV